jgi:hypothetical protein
VETNLHFKCEFHNGTKTAFKKICQPGRVIDIPAGCTANAPLFTVNRASIDVSAQLDSIYVTHEDFELDYLLGPGLENMPEGKPNITLEVKRFLRNYSQTSLQAIDLGTIQSIASFHQQLDEIMSSNSEYRWPTLSEFTTQGFTSIIAVIICCLTIYAIFKLVSCFWGTKAGNAIRNLTYDRPPTPVDESQRHAWRVESWRQRMDHYGDDSSEQSREEREMRLMARNDQYQRPTPRSSRSYRNRNRNRDDPEPSGAVPMRQITRERKSAGPTAKSDLYANSATEQRVVLSNPSCTINVRSADQNQFNKTAVGDRPLSSSAPPRNAAESSLAKTLRLAEQAAEAFEANPPDE